MMPCAQEGRRGYEQHDHRRLNSTLERGFPKRRHVQLTVYAAPDDDGRDDR
jgi:hypothetical protein